MTWSFPAPTSDLFRNSRGLQTASKLHLLTQHLAQKLGTRAKQREHVIAAIRRELDDD